MSGHPDERVAELERRNAELWALNERLASSAAAGPTPTGQLIAGLEHDLARERATLAAVREQLAVAEAAGAAARAACDAARWAQEQARATESALTDALAQARAREAALTDAAGAMADEAVSARAAAQRALAQESELRARRVVRLGLALTWALRRSRKPGGRARG